MDKLTAMHTFVVVAKSGSFSTAAQALAVPKTRVSQRIQELEAALSIRLLNRTTRVVSLTEEGRIYLGKCEQILQEVNEAEQLISQTRDEPSGRLNISCMSIVARSLIMPRLDEFLSAYPKISISLSVTDRIVNLNEYGVDCAIRGGQMESSSLISRQIAQASFGLYGSARLLTHHPTITHPAELGGMPLVKVIGQRDGQVRHWALSCGEEKFQERSTPRIETDDDQIALECALAGTGLALLPEFAAVAYVATGELVRVLPGWCPPMRPIFAIYPSRRYVSAKLRKFLDWVELLM